MGLASKLLSQTSSSTFLFPTQLLCIVISVRMDPAFLSIIFTKPYLRQHILRFPDPQLNCRLLGFEVVDD